MNNSITVRNVLFSSDKIPYCIDDVQNLIEMVLNEIPIENNTFKGSILCEVMYIPENKINDDDNLENVSFRKWCELKEDTFNSECRFNKKLLLYDDSTKSWIVILNNNLSDEMKKTLSSNYTHCIIIDNDKLNNVGIKTKLINIITVTDGKTYTEKLKHVKCIKKEIFEK